MATIGSSESARRADVIVIGLGAYGSATADALARSGHRVIGIEAHERGHTNGSSHGTLRIIRRAVEEGPFYVPFVLDAFERWDHLAADSGSEIIARNGAIRIAPDGSPLHDALRASADAHGLAYEALSPADVHQRFPGFAVPEGYAALFEAEAGVLFADRSVRAFQTRALRHGAELHFSEPVLGWSVADGVVTVRTSHGAYEADRLVITAGPWTTQLTPDLTLPLVVHRIVNAFFEPLERPLFERDRLPAFIVADETHGVYGLPAVPGEGLKVGTEGTATDPDAVRREVDEQDVAGLRATVERFLPRAAGPLTGSLTCLYTMAPDGHFVIDHHPEHPEVVIASPCSGHGFKYVSSIGPVLAELATHGTSSFDLGPFSIGRFARVPA